MPAKFREKSILKNIYYFKEYEKYIQWRKEGRFFLVEIINFLFNILI